MGSIVEVDSNKPEQKILEEVAKILFVKDSQAPKKPPKVVLMGPPGVDLKEHAAHISKKYGVVNLELNEICNEFIKKQGDNSNVAQLKKLMKNGEPIPDDIAMDLLKERLAASDCRK
jgi:hypothetical protein